MVSTKNILEFRDFELKMFQSLYDYKEILRDQDS